MLLISDMNMVATVKSKSYNTAAELYHNAQGTAKSIRRPFFATV